MWKIDRSITAVFASSLKTNGAAKKTAAKVYTLDMRKISKANDVTLAVLDVYYSRISFQTGVQPSKNTIGVNEVLGWLADRIYEYFNFTPNTPNTQRDFDEFHESLCDGYMTKLNACRCATGYPDITYGNAQKMINMVFKYLACYEDYNKYADLFSYCHIPIDEDILVKLNTIFYVPNINIYRYHYKGLPWTSFTKPIYKDLVNDYRAAMGGIIGAHPWLGIDFWYWNTTPPYASLPAAGTPVTPISQFHT